MRYPNGTPESTKYVLIDFSCSREYTHHAEYLSAFANHLHGMNFRYELWINRAADSGVRSMLRRHPVFPILNTLEYSFKRNENFPLFILNKIAKDILSMQKISFLPTRFQERILDFAARLLSRSAIRRLKVLYGKHQRVVMVFPSADGLALRFLRLLAVGNFDQISVSMRIIGAERRGILGVKDFVPLINEIAHGVSDLRIGWEVEPMKTQMIESGILPEKLYWAPIPTSSSLICNSSSPKKMTLGFLGSARKNKGFSEIPSIVNSIRYLDIGFQVQKANFAWDGYLGTLNELLSLGDRINFLPGAASNRELNQALSKCSVLVLPYDLDSYRFAGSGIMYQAANLGIPIFCTDGVGFDWDVKNFLIGSTFRTLDELQSLIINFDSSSYFRNIVKYNQARNQACSEFLG